GDPFAVDVPASTFRVELQLEPFGERFAGQRGVADHEPAGGPAEHHPVQEAGQSRVDDGGNEQPEPAAAEHCEKVYDFDGAWQLNANDAADACTLGSQDPGGADHDRAAHLLVAA